MSDRRVLAVLLLASFILGIAVHARLGGFGASHALESESDTVAVPDGEPKEGVTCELVSPPAAARGPEVVPSPPTAREEEVVVEGRCWIIPADHQGERHPAADARITLTAAGEPEPGEGVLHREVLADAQGHFRIPGLPRGAHVRIHMERDDLYCRRERSPKGGDVHLVRVVWPADHARESSHGLKLTEDLHAVELSATRGYVVRGRILDEKGAGIPDVLVRMHSGSDHQILEVRSGPDGHYRLGCFDSLRGMRAKVSRVGYRTTEFREDLREAAGSGFEVSRDVVMSRAGAIKVLALSHDGRRVEGLRVGIAPDGERMQNALPVVANESVVFDGLVPGRAYRVFLLEKGFPNLPLSVSEKLEPREEVLEVELRQPPRGRVNVNVDLFRFPSLAEAEARLFHRSTSVEIAGRSWQKSRRSKAYASARLDGGGKAWFEVPAIGGWRVLVVEPELRESLLATAVYPPRKNFDHGRIVLGKTIARMPSRGTVDFYFEEPLLAGRTYLKSDRERMISLRSRPLSGVAQAPFVKRLNAGRKLSTGFLWPDVYEMSLADPDDEGERTRRSLRIESGMSNTLDLDR